jgi:hypothetical protein
MSTPLGITRAGGVEDAAVRLNALTPRAPRLRQLAAAESIKLGASRLTPVLLLVGIAVAGYGAYSTASTAVSGWGRRTALMHAQYDPSSAALRNPYFTALMIGAALLGAMTLCSEYSTGLIRSTFTAVPARGRVVLAKAVVTAVTLALFGLVVALVCWGAALSAFGDTIGGYSFGTPGLVRAVLATMALLAVCGLIGLAVAAVLRNLVATTLVIAVFFADFITDTGMAQPNGGSLVNLTPWLAWTRLVAFNPQALAGSGEPSATAAWLTLAAWAVLAVAVAAFAVRRREA